MEKKIDFESKLKELNDLVNKIQDEQLPLNEAMELFEKGKEIVKELEKGLEEAEQKVVEVLK